MVSLLYHDDTKSGKLIPAAIFHTYPKDEIRGLLGSCCRMDYQLFIIPQFPEPRLYIACTVLDGLVLDANHARKHRRTHFRYQLLFAVDLIPKVMGVCDARAIQPRFVACAMREFVE